MAWMALRLDTMTRIFEGKGLGGRKIVVARVQRCFDIQHVVWVIVVELRIMYIEGRDYIPHYTYVIVLMTYCMFLQLYVFIYIHFLFR